MNKIKDLNKWGDNPCTCIGRFNIVKMFVFPKLMCKFSPTPTKIPARYFVDIDKLAPIFLWKDQRPRIANRIWMRKTKSEDWQNETLRRTTKPQ